MNLSSHCTEFAGHKVQLFDPTKPLAGQATDIASVAWRAGGPFNYDDETMSIKTAFAALAKDPDVGQIRALVVGTWASYENDAPGGALILENAAKLGGLEHLFLADIVGEESEISWIEHGELGPLFGALPKLKTLVIRGGAMKFDCKGSETLQKLVVQSGGMPPASVAQLGAASWPALEHLELWLGTDAYGGGSKPEHLQGILNGQSFPSVRWLGLMNSDNADQVAAALMQSPLLAQVRDLDLSMGILTDEGGKALLEAAGSLAHLNSLHLGHHYFGDATRAQVAGALPMVRGLDEPGESDDDGEGGVWRFVEVAE